MKFIGNYYTIVESSFGEKKEEICFRRHIGPHRTAKAFYDIWIIKGFDLIKTGHNHCCLVNKNQILSLIKTLKKIYPFHYTLKDEDYKGKAAYHLHIDINGTYAERLFILTALRYTYEYPYNVLLSEAFRLTNLSEFKWINLIDLTSLVDGTIFGTHFSAGHGLSPSPNHASLRTLHNNISKALYVHDVIPRSPFRDPIIKAVDKNTLEFWMDSNEFIKRVKLYKKELNKFLVK